MGRQTFTSKHIASLHATRVAMRLDTGTPAQPRPEGGAQPGACPTKLLEPDPDVDSMLPPRGGRRGVLGVRRGAALMRPESGRAARDRPRALVSAAC